MREVAQRLGVSRRRVVELVRSGRLAAPVAEGDDQRWREVDVEALAAARDGVTVSVPAGALSPPVEPLTLVCDRVAQHGPDQGGREARRPMHLRVWDGRGPEGRRVVVLFGALRGQPVALDEAAVEVAGVWLPDGVGPSEVVWCRTGHAAAPGQDRPGSDVSGLESVVFTWPSIEVGLSGWLAEQLAPALRLPSFELGPLSYATLAAVIGAPVAVYPAAVYTAETVRRRDRADGVIEVGDDDVGLAATCAAIAAFDKQADPDTEPGVQRRVDAARAAVELAADLRGRRELRDGQRGGAEAAAPRGAWWAARIVAVEPSPEQAALLERYTADMLPAGSNGEAGEVAFLARLWAWAEEVHRHAETPDPTLEDALDRVAGRVEAAVWARRRREHGSRADAPRPAVEVRVFALAGELDQAYLAGLDPIEPAGSADPGMRRRGRVLAAAAAPPDPVALRYGLDPHGHLVAYPDPGAAARMGERGWFAVEWPLHRPDRPVAGVVAVAESDPRHGGERPVYLDWPDGALTPLPSRARGALRPPWRFGTPHGGTRALAEDLAALLTPDGPDTVEEQRWEQLCSSVEAVLADPAQRSRLRIDLDENC